MGLGPAYWVYMDDKEYNRRMKSPPKKEVSPTPKINFCKDCKYRTRKLNCYVCGLTDLVITSDDFCSKFEKDEK